MNSFNCEKLKVIDVSHTFSTIIRILHEGEGESISQLFEEEYIKKTIYFANNIELLNNTRLKLYNNKENNPIFNSKVFAQDFISALKNVWDNYKNNKI